MPMDRQSETVTKWDVNRVHSWFASLGFPNYESQIKEQDINGEILVLLDHEGLKDLGVRSVGHRISILKAIYNLKIQHNVPIELGQYVPPSAEFESAMNVTNGVPDLRKIEGAIQERDALISHLSKEVQRLSSELAKLREEMIPVLKMAKENKPLPEPERNSIDNLNTPSTSRTNLSVQVPGISVTNFSKSPTYSSDGSSAPPSPHSPHDSGNSRRHYNNEFDSRPSASFHQTPVINDAINFFGNHQSYKSFRVSLEDPCHKVLPAALKKYKIADDWRQYALFIRFGSTDHLTERCLSYDEKPLLLFQKLKEASQNPVFMLKNIKEIKSPIATAEEIISLLKANKKRRTTQFLNKELPPAPNEYPDTHQEPPPDYESTEERISEETLIEGNGTAVAIYPYVPELDDELNVVVGDIFKIRSRSGGWCFVERDGQTGWVPANFLLETSVNGGDMMDSDSPYVGRGVALIDYKRNTDDELSVKKDDLLRIYKRQDYWLYCEINNERGWVPSWYVRVDKEAIDDESEVNE
ncbi:20897_t:CDS:2 [Cetraspora pellucida]|uniref:20897_t:CDS:1 n=1 Tax=Cetraspora pellucida TaxID=1433469 RepID=A0A9N9AXW1_9GLOM|nr:20897_t:CDS:2 [Cetraspora pellucida]